MQNISSIDYDIKIIFNINLKEHHKVSHHESPPIMNTNDTSIFSNAESAHKLYIINIIDVIKSLNTINIFETTINIIEADLT